MVTGKAGKVTPDGSKEVYIGKSHMEMASNEALIADHARQFNSDEVDYSPVNTNVLHSLDDLTQGS